MRPARGPLRRAGTTALALACALPTVACGGGGAPVADDPRETTRPAPAAEAFGEVVARVDGVPITLRDVEEVARGTDLSPREALRRIEDELLLSAAAERAGTSPDESDELVARRAMVQALLRVEIEERITSETLDEELVRARIARDAAMFSQPERRRSVHVLVRRRRGAEGDDGAIERAIAERADEISAVLREESDPAAAALPMANPSTGPGDVLEILAEEVGPARLGGSLDDAYEEALFALAGPGAVSDPVPAEHGVHVIVCGEILPPWAMPEGEVERIVRRQLVVEARAQALLELEERLAAAHPPELEAPNVERLLVSDLSGLEP